LPETGGARRSASSQGSSDGRRPQERAAIAALDGENGVVRWVDRQNRQYLTRTAESLSRSQRPARAFTWNAQSRGPIWISLGTPRNWAL